MSGDTLFPGMDQSPDWSGSGENGDGGLLAHRLDLEEEEELEEMGPAYAAESVCPTEDVEAGLVGVVVDILTADWKRQGGRLSVDDFTRQVTKRNLCATDADQVINRLGLEGIAIDGLSGKSEPAAEPIGRPRKPRRPTGGKDPLSVFLCEAQRYPLLSPEQERNLARRIRAAKEATSHAKATGQISGALAAIVQRGEEARRQMACSNLRLVVHVAREFYKPGSFLELCDLVQDGCVGLLRAVDRFDPNRGTRFSTYAVWWIRQRVLRCLQNEECTVRLPVHVVASIQKIRRAKRLFYVRNGGRSPTVHELARETGMDPGKVDGLLQTEHIYTLQSLDAPVGDDGAGLVDVISCPRTSDFWAQFNRKLLRGQLAYLLATLSKREASILRARFGLGDEPEQTLEEVGEELGVTRERVRQLQSKAMERLKRRGKRLGLGEYLVD